MIRLHFKKWPTFYCIVSPFILISYFTAMLFSYSNLTFSIYIMYAYIICIYIIICIIYISVWYSICAPPSDAETTHFPYGSNKGLVIRIYFESNDRKTTCKNSNLSAGRGWLHPPCSSTFRHQRVLQIIERSYKRLTSRPADSERIGAQRHGHEDTLRTEDWAGDPQRIPVKGTIWN